MNKIFDPNIIPSQPGSYAFEMTFSQTFPVVIGRLGEFLLHPGTYIYLGSALGYGGLRARLSHHILSDQVKPRWHVDYLRMYARPTAVCWIVHSGKEPGIRLECRMSQFFSKLSGAAAIIPGFGSSDCTSKCIAHLWYFKQYTSTPHSLCASLAWKLPIHFKKEFGFLQDPWDFSGPIEFSELS